MQAVKDKQLMITVNDKAGTLAEINSLIAGAGINMMAICAYAVDNKGFIMFVSEDNNRSKRLLKTKKFDVREEEVIVLTLDNKPGQLQAVTNKIAEIGIDLTLIYGSVERKAKTSTIILVAEDVDTVLTVIKMLNM